MNVLIAWPSSNSSSSLIEQVPCRTPQVTMCRIVSCGPRSSLRLQGYLRPITCLERCGRLPCAPIMCMLWLAHGGFDQLDSNLTKKQTVQLKLDSCLSASHLP